MKKITFLLGLSLLMPLTAEAQLFIERGKIQIDVKPGQTVADSLIIHNTSNQKIEIRIYWEDFYYGEPFDGSKMFFPAGTADRSMSQWIKFSPQVIHLSPFTKRKVSYTIKVPETIQGGYYGVLFFERTVDQPELETGLHIISRVGTLFFVESALKDKSAGISGLKFEGGELFSQFENNGNVVLIPDGVYYIMNGQGLVVDRGQIDKVYLPAGKVADYNISTISNLPGGRYTMIITVDLLDGDVMVKEIDFQKTSSGQNKITNIRD